MERRIEALGYAALLLAALLACGGKTKEEAGASPASSGAPSVAASAPAPAVPVAPAWQTVPLDKLLGTYKDNEVKGDQDYKGKVIRVAGLVGEVKKDAITDAIYVTIGKGALLEIPIVQCFAAAGKLNPVMKTCERLGAAVGGKCAPMKDTPDAATLERKGEKEALLGAVMCLPTRERYQKGLEVFKDRTVIGNEKALCLGAFETITKAGKAGPVTDEAVKAKIKTFFDAL